jgi:hypothetical protein
MQQFYKDDTAAKKRWNIQEGAHYWVGREVIKREATDTSVQFRSRQLTTWSPEFRREMKIRLPGRAAQNTETED